MPRTSPQTERIVMLTQLLADQPDTGRTLADIARHLGVAKATCYPMVIALVEAGWLLRHPVHKTYRLGPALIPIGCAARVAVDVVDLARPILRRLADATDLSCLALVQSGSDLVVGEVVQPLSGRRGTLGLRVGDKIHVAPPLGAAVAAWYASDQLEEWFELGAQDLGLETVILCEHYEPRLALIRERGYAVECLDQQELTLAEAVTELRGRGIAGQRAVLALREARRRLSVDVLLGGIEPARRYQPISINAAAFGPDETPAAVLCAVDAPAPLPGARILALGDAVKDAADQLAAALHGHPPRR